MKRSIFTLAIMAVLRHRPTHGDYGWFWGVNTRDTKILETLRGEDILLLVADRDEITESEVHFPVIYTGMGKMRMYSALIYDRIDLPGEGASVFSGDYFMSTQTFNPEQVRTLSQKYDLFDMEAYAAALFCREHCLPFYCFKAVSDNLDGSLKDWRGILGDIRKKYVEMLKAL